MPLNRNGCLDVMTVDPFATTATKTFPNSLDKRKGFKYLRKEKISTWELIEGVKNASSLCMSWYGSSKIERKMLRYEHQQKLLVRHKHLNIHKELTYFSEKSQLPNDIVEIGQQQIVIPPTQPSVTAINTVPANVLLNNNNNPNAATVTGPGGGMTSSNSSNMPVNASSLLNAHLLNKKDLKPQNLPLINNNNMLSNEQVNLASPLLNSPNMHPGMMQQQQQHILILIQH